MEYQWESVRETVLATSVSDAGGGALEAKCAKVQVLACCPKSKTTATQVRHRQSTFQNSISLIALLSHSLLFLDLKHLWPTAMRGDVINRKRLPQSGSSPLACHSVGDTIFGTELNSSGIDSDNSGAEELLVEGRGMIGPGRNSKKACSSDFEYPAHLQSAQVPQARSVRNRRTHRSGLELFYQVGLLFYIDFFGSNSRLFYSMASFWVSILSHPVKIEAVLKLINLPLNHNISKNTHSACPELASDNSEGASLG